MSTCGSGSSSSNSRRRSSTSLLRLLSLVSESCFSSATRRRFSLNVSASRTTIAPRVSAVSVATSGVSASARSTSRNANATTAKIAGDANERQPSGRIEIRWTGSGCSAPAAIIAVPTTQRELFQALAS